MATKFRLPKIGEGTRERRPSKYGEGGREVGGNARRHALKGSVSGTAKAKSSSAVRGGSVPPSTLVSVPDEDGMPEPGGHPARLIQRARDAGYKSPTDDNAFARLKRMSQALAEGHTLEAHDVEEAAAAPVTGKLSAPTDLDHLFDKPVEVDRPTRVRAEALSKLAKSRARLPILRRPTKHIDAGGSHGRDEHGDEVERAAVGAATKGAIDAGREGPGGRGDVASSPYIDPRQLSLFPDTPLSNEITDPQAVLDGKLLLSGEGQGAEASLVQTTSEAPLPSTAATTNGEPKGTAHTSPSTGTDDTGDEAGVTAYTEDQELDIMGILDMPGVVCDNCPMAEHCPAYQPAHKCAYDEDYAGLTTRNVSNFIPTLELLADIQKKRAMRGVMMESRLAGGQLDPNVTRQIEVAASAAERVMRYKAPTTKSANSSITVVAQGNGIAKGGGILSKLLSGSGIDGAPGELTLNPPQDTIVVHAESSTPTPVASPYSTRMDGDE